LCCSSVHGSIAQAAASCRGDSARLVGFGAAFRSAIALVPDKPKTAMGIKVSEANSRCPSFAALAPIARSPRA
jgi:hypothetical protein